MKTYFIIPAFMQLFTNHVNVTTDARSSGQTYPTYNDLSPEMKTYYDMTLLDEAGPQLVHQQFGQKRPIPAGSGKVIEFRKFSNLPKATTPLTEGVTPDGKRLDVTSITSTVAQYGDYVTQSDILELTAVDNTIVETTKLLGKQAGLTLDTVVRNKLVAGTNVSYCGTWSGTTETAVTSRIGLNSTAKLTVKTLKKISAKLRGQNTPTVGGKYIGIIHPFVAYDLMNDPDWIDFHKYSRPDNLFEGEIGELAGFRFVQTTEAKVWSAAPLTAAARNLTVASLSTKTITVDEAISSAEATALAGRKVIIDGKQAEIASSASGAAGSATITLKEIPSGMSPADGDIIYPGEAAGDGSSVFGSLFFGENAYGVTEITGGGLQTIVKQKGSAGTADPLDQRSSVGWKAIITAELLIPNYLVRCESCSPDFQYTEAN